ncbi:MAG: quinolinate synthase NadA [Lachnospiraceae bacterium]|nr:quinolinate synthase NadA [Lachnospiraceae bacterium]
MNVREMQDEIMRLKKENDFCILVHAYQSHDIVEVADYVGDSYGLSLKAKEAPQKNILMCGVRFMAQVVKSLSPDKNVYLSNSMAGCPMAEQLTREDVLRFKEKYPDHAVCAYINTTSELKTVCDVIVTSSSAVEILKKYPAKKILFIPDCNLGRWVQEQLPEKEFEFYSGGCPTHTRVTAADVEKAKKEHPGAELLVHPECRWEVVKEADYVGSTTGIMAYAKKSDKKDFIIGTEQAIVQHLQFECPDKNFYLLSEELVCKNMKATTLVDVYNCLTGKIREEIVMSDELINDSLKPIEKMVELGG